jgi:hypothetical protein
VEERMVERFKRRRQVGHKAFHKERELVLGDDWAELLQRSLLHARKVTHSRTNRSLIALAIG